MKTVYKCDCGKEFDSHADCLAHERESHIKPLSYIDHNTIYHNELSQYPDELEVGMVDGAIVRYMFESIIKAPTEKENAPQGEA